MHRKKLAEKPQGIFHGLQILSSQNKMYMNFQEEEEQDGKLKMRPLTLSRTRDIILSIILVMDINTYAMYLDF